MKLSLTPALGFSGGVSTPRTEQAEVRLLRPKGRKGVLVDAVRPVITDPPSSSDTTES